MNPMNPTNDPQREPTLADIVTQLEKLTNEVSLLGQQSKLTTDEVSRLSKDRDQSQKWQDRTWDVVKWVGGISAALSISAAIALVGLFIREAIMK
jgi:hypothetical protein